MNGADEPPERRRYDNSSRQAQARQTRARVIDAARTLFVENGYAATSLSHVARAAQVSVPTIQKTFGTKAAVIKAVYDVTLAGDDQPIPMASRPEFVRLEAETDPQETLRLYCEIGRDLWSRLGALFPTILAGALSGEPDLVELRATIASQSRTGAADLVGQLDALNGLRRGLDPAEAVDTMWWLLQPEQYVILVHHAGWTLDHYVAWFHQTASWLLMGTPVSSKPAEPG
jgi:AcrR family transcriptional regulator